MQWTCRTGRCGSILQTLLSSWPQHTGLLPLCCTSVSWTIRLCRAGCISSLESYANDTHWVITYTHMLVQSCPTHCDPMNHSPPGSSVHGILQARILEWVSKPSSRTSSQSRDGTCVSCFAGRFFTAEAPGKPTHTPRQSVLLPCNILSQVLFWCSGLTVASPF